MKTRLIIVGAGISGLMAAYELSRAGFEVTLLEAAAQPGGRIKTLTDPRFSTAIEAGAEFIHGNLPHTFSLLAKAKISYTAAASSMQYVKAGKFESGNDLEAEWHALFQKMLNLEEDMVFDLFLQQQFPGPSHTAITKAAANYANGFDLADTAIASTKALAQEWSNEQESLYRVDGGYGLLVQYLLRKAAGRGTKLLLNTVVKNVIWNAGNITAVAEDGNKFEADKILLTLPAGVMQAPAASAGSVTFEPAIPAYLQAYHEIGFGNVIKIILRFDKPFWKEKAGDIGFFLTDELIPTWWTQESQNDAVLTGWLGGPRSQEPAYADREWILQTSLDAIANIFHVPVPDLKEYLLEAQVFNWSENPFALGGYSFSTPLSSNARKLLNQPIADTLYFAGEALYDGETPGTVEAALESGINAAERIRKSIPNSNQLQ